MAQREDEGLSRRRFLRRAGGAWLASSAMASAASTSLDASGAAVEAQVPNLKLPPAPGKKLGYALVGLGSLAINQLMPAFAKCEQAKLTAFVSGRPEKAKLLAQRYGVSEKNIYGYDTFDSIASNPDIDIVYIVLPNSMHAEYTVRALKAGKHVLCEKPMANTPAECEQMIAAAKAANRKLQIGYRLRYEPNNQAMIKIARDRELGALRMILTEAAFNIGDPAQWRLRRAMAGGGSLMDIGVYALNAARYLSGEEPTEVSAIIQTTPNDPRFTEVEETVLFQLRFPSGLLAQCTSSYGFNINRFRLIAQQGAAELEPALGYTGLQMRVLRGGNVEARNLPVRDHFAAEMDALAACVINGTDSLTPGEEGLRDLRVMMAIYESAKAGHPIKIPA